jgi:hypothetical protein
MKTMFRKAVSVLTSAALIGSTVTMAAAVAYPAPFNAGNSAVVYGADSATADMTAAATIQNNINAALVSDGGETTVTGGDSFKFEKTSTKFHLGDSILDVVGTSLDDKDLPTILADGTYTDDDNAEFDFKQSITMANDTLEMFDDDSYKRDSPTLGFYYANGDAVLDYTLDFTENPDWEDIVATDLTILGKEYYVLSTSGNNSITLLDSATTTVLSEGDSTTTSVGGKSYDASIDFVGDTPEVKLTVNGETTNTLGEGETYKLNDGSYIGVKDIMYSAKDSGISKVEFSIGAGKLVLTSGSEVELNSEDIDNLDVTITSTGATPEELDTIVLSWDMDGEGFVTEDSTVTMPGFESVSVAYTGLNYPVTEEIVVKSDGDDNLVLQDFQLQDVTETITLLYSNSTNFTLVGKDSNNLLGTAGIGDTLNYTGETMDYFVVSYKSGDDAESYLVRATNWEDNAYPDNVVDFEYMSGSTWTNIDTAMNASDEVSVGNALFTVGAVSNESAEWVTVTAGTDTNFDRIYSVEGLEVQLPWMNTTDVTLTGPNQTCAATYSGTGMLGYDATITMNNSGTVACLSNPATYSLILSEEDKDDTISAGDDITVAVGLDTDSEVYVTSVSTTNADATAAEIGDGEVYRDFTYSDLATEILDDQSGDSEKVTIIYHGAEVKADVYVTSADAMISSGESGVAILDDSAAVTGKNVVVVGGSAINAIAAELVGAVRGPAFTEATAVAAGEFLIETFAYNGNVALLVAGYDAADTTKAATYLTNTDDEIMVEEGKKYTGSSATEATLVTTA